MNMSDWLEKMQAQRASICAHPDFQAVDKLLQRMITGITATAQQVSFRSRPTCLEARSSLSWAKAERQAVLAAPRAMG